MSFYNMLNGVNPATFFILPMLGKHPDSYPRFRDCFIGEDNNIHVFTRVGGGNRNEGFGEEKLYKHENFISTFDDDFDSTYGTYVFSVPEKWKNDFELIKKGEFKQVSTEYKIMIKDTFPKLKEKLDTLWPEV